MLENEPAQGGPATVRRRAVAQTGRPARVRDEQRGLAEVRISASDVRDSPHDRLGKVLDDGLADELTPLTPASVRSQSVAHDLRHGHGVHVRLRDFACTPCTTRNET